MKPLHSWPCIIWKCLARVVARTRKRNKQVVKGNAQDPKVIVLELWFPTHWDLWKTHDTPWQSPTCCKTLPIHPNSSPYTQPNTSRTWSSCGFSSTAGWSACDLVFLFLESLTFFFWLDALFIQNPIKCLNFKKPCTYSLTKYPLPYLWYLLLCIWLGCV